MAQPVTKQNDTTGHEDLVLPTTTEDITVLLQQNIDKLVEKLKWLKEWQEWDQIENGVVNSDTFYMCSYLTVTQYV